MGYFFRLTARVLLYAPSHRQDNTYQEHWLEREILREKTQQCGISQMGTDLRSLNAGHV